MSAPAPGGKKGLHLRISSSDCSIHNDPAQKEFQESIGFKSRSFKSSSVVFVLPRLIAAMKRLVSIKNFIFLSCKLVGLFLDLGFEPVQISVLGLLYDLVDQSAEIDLL